MTFFTQSILFKIADIPVHWWTLFYSNFPFISPEHLSLCNTLYNLYTMHTACSSIPSIQQPVGQDLCFVYSYIKLLEQCSLNYIIGVKQRPSEWMNFWITLPVTELSTLYTSSHPLTAAPGGTNISLISRKRRVTCLGHTSENGRDRIRPHLPLGPEVLSLLHWVPFPIGAGNSGAKALCRPCFQLKFPTNSIFNKYGHRES